MPKEGYKVHFHTYNTFKEFIHHLALMESDLDFRAESIEVLGRVIGWDNISHYLTDLYSLADINHRLYCVNNITYPFFTRPEWTASKQCPVLKLELSIDNSGFRPLSDEEYYFLKSFLRFRDIKPWNGKIYRLINFESILTTSSRSFSFHFDEDNYYGYIATCEYIFYELIFDLMREIPKEKSFNDCVIHDYQKASYFQKRKELDLLDFNNRVSKLGLNFSLFLKDNDEYCTYWIHRSGQVSEEENMTAVVPAGSFTPTYIGQTLGQEPQFNIEFCVLRELVEELYGKTELEKALSNTDPLALFDKYPITRDILLSRQQHKSRFVVTGFGIMANTFKPELIGSLIIDDEALSKKMKEEIINVSDGEGEINFISVNDLLGNLKPPHIKGTKKYQFFRPFVLDPPAVISWLKGIDAIENNYPSTDSGIDRLTTFKHDSFSGMGQYFTASTITDVERLGSNSAIDINKMLCIINNVSIDYAQHSFYGIIGNSFSINKIKTSIAKIKESDTTVLIVGESGTGKELIATAIKETSSRKNKPFIALLIQTIPEDILDSELFGIEKGVATGVCRRAGKFEQSDGGTLFIDEVGDIPLHLQVKLLRLLEGHSFEKIGGKDKITIDTRIILATNKSLEKEIENGTFRSDLYYRLSSYIIAVPPLRDRLEDIPLISRYFANTIANKMNKPIPIFTKEALIKMISHKWYGNVRELHNCINSAIINIENNVITDSDIIFSDINHYNHVDTLNIDMTKKQKLITALENSYNAEEAATKLNISRATLFNWAKKYGIANPTHYCKMSSR